jgi:hypothetical protein
MATEGMFEREKDPVRDAMGMELQDSDFSERVPPLAHGMWMQAGVPARE